MSLLSGMFPIIAGTFIVVSLFNIYSSSLKVRKFAARFLPRGLLNELDSTMRIYKDEVSPTTINNEITIYPSKIKIISLGLIMIVLPSIMIYLSIYYSQNPELVIDSTGNEFYFIIIFALIVVFIGLYSVFRKPKIIKINNDSIGFKLYLYYLFNKRINFIDFKSIKIIKVNLLHGEGSGIEPSYKIYLYLNDSSLITFGLFFYDPPQVERFLSVIKGLPSLKDKIEFSREKMPLI